MALQSGISLRQPCALDLFKDCGALGFPAIGRGFEVVVREVDVDRCDQFVDARKAAFTDDVVGELAKEALDEVEPGGTGRGKVDLNARMLLQPSADGGTHAFDTINHMFLMSGVIVPGSTYWNLGFGLDKGEVAKDDEASRNMNDLGQTIAWLRAAIHQHAGSRPPAVVRE